MNCYTNAKMPSLGVVDALVPEFDSVERMRFWLLMHTLPWGERLFRTMVLRECLPGPQILEGLETP